MTGSVAFARPLVGGVFWPFRYSQSTNAESGLPAGITAIQSVGVPGPFDTVTDTVPPLVSVVGVTVRVVVGALPCTVIVGLVARSVQPPLAKNFRT